MQIRVEQVLGGENGPVLLYKLSNLFKFYYDTIKYVIKWCTKYLFTVVLFDKVLFLLDPL